MSYEVRLRDGESSENLIKRFMRKAKKQRIVEEVLDRSHYRKPSEERRRKATRRKAVLDKLRKQELEKEKYER